MYPSIYPPIPHLFICPLHICPSTHPCKHSSIQPSIAQPPNHPFLWTSNYSITCSSAQLSVHLCLFIHPSICTSIHRLWNPEDLGVNPYFTTSCQPQMLSVPFPRHQVLAISVHTSLASSSQNLNLFAWGLFLPLSLICPYMWKAGGNGESTPLENSLQPMTRQSWCINSSASSLLGRVTLRWEFFLGPRVPPPPAGSSSIFSQWCLAW